jgi:integrase
VVPGTFDGGGGGVSPFKRTSGVYALYIPRRSGGVVQRTCGTKDAKLAKAMGRMVRTLRDQRRWDVLDAIDAGTLTVPAAWDAYSMNRLDDAVAAAHDERLLPIAKRWLASLTVAPRTHAVYRGKVDRIIPADLTVAQFTPGWVRDTIAALPVTSGTKGQYLHVLTSLADYCVAHGHLESNRLRERGLVPRHRTNAPRVLWKEEADDVRLVNAAPEPERSYFALVHATGAERDAALVMVRRDLDLDAATCHIPGTKTRTRDRRGVPIEPWALPILRAHVAGLLPDAPLFPGLTRDHLNRAHRAARTVAKLDGYQLRDARHSYAVRAILRGEPIWKVSKWLGHANLGITARVYTQFNLADALDAIGAPNATAHATSRRRTS